MFVEFGVETTVGQVEQGMADSGILPVNQPDASAIIDQIGR